MYHLDYFRYQDGLAAIVFPCLLHSQAAPHVLVPISHVDLVPGAPTIDKEEKRWLRKCTLTSHASYGTFSPVTVSEKYPA